MLGLIVNTLTTNYEYSRSHRENLMLPIEIKLSEKPSMFVGIFFFWIFGFYIKFSMFLKKTMSHIGQVFLKLLSLKYVLIKMDKRCCFWKPYGSERFKESQNTLKSAEEYFHPSFS